jgi:hemin uptake protein HemP
MFKFYQRFKVINSLKKELKHYTRVVEVLDSHGVESLIGEDNQQTITTLKKAIPTLESNESYYTEQSILCTHDDKLFDLLKGNRLACRKIKETYKGLLSQLEKEENAKNN